MNNAFGNHVELTTHRPGLAVDRYSLLGSLFQVDWDDVLCGSQLLWSGVDTHTVDHRFRVAQQSQTATEALNPRLLDGVVQRVSQGTGDEIGNVSFHQLTGNTPWQDDVPQGLHQSRDRDVVWLVHIVVLVVQQPNGQ